MNFTLTINGETPAELLDTLTQLGGMTINVNTSPNGGVGTHTMTINVHTSPNGGVETHTMTAAECPKHNSPLPPQSTPVQQPDKPKAQTPAKAKKPTREPAAAPAEEPANPTTAEASGSPSQADAAPAASTPAPDPATLDKIRDLARSLIVAGKRAGVQAAIKTTGAASISKLPPDSYTNVWEELLKLKDEVDANAAD